jgi:hypothetical protein
VWATFKVGAAAPPLLFVACFVASEAGIILEEAHADCMPAPPLLILTGCQTLLLYSDPLGL